MSQFFTVGFPIAIFKSAKEFGDVSPLTPGPSGSGDEARCWTARDGDDDFLALFHAPHELGCVLT